MEDRGTSRARTTPIRALRVSLFLGSACAAAVIAACSSTSSNDSSSSSGGAQQCSGLPTTCVAFAPDFSGYRTWAADTINNDEDLGNAHLKGPRTSYINHRPAAGASEFPIGTIIVKEMDSSDDITQRQVFAMVKRGGGFNAGGASNWEWFELQNDDATSSHVIWRGATPPLGETYAGSPASDCNTCHEAAKTNDFVQDPNLSLASSAPASSQ